MERRQRLRKGTEFDSVYSEGTFVGGALLVLRYRANAGEVPRWGFAVGKRLARQSARRNRVRRRLREAAQTFVLDRAVDIVVTARKGAVEASYLQLRASLGAGLVRAGLLPGEER